MCVVFVLSLTIKAQKEEKKVVFGVAGNPFTPMTSLGGKGSADMREFFQIVTDEVKKYYGYEAELKIFPAPKFLLKAIKAKQVDFCFGYLGIYLYAKRIGMPVVPVFTTTVGGAKMDKECIYVRKASGIKNVKQLQGKPFVKDFPVFLSKKDSLPPKEGYMPWIFVKKILSQSGVNKRFKDFFKEFRVLPVPVESMVYSVLLKKFDATAVTPYYMQMLILYDKGFSELTPLSCVDFRGIPWFYRKGVPEETLKTLLNYFFSPPPGSQLEKMLKKEYKSIKPVQVSEKDYDVLVQWLKEAEQKGWIDEFNGIMKETLAEMKKKEQKEKLF